MSSSTTIRTQFTDIEVLLRLFRNQPNAQISQVWGRTEITFRGNVRLSNGLTFMSKDKVRISKGITGRYSLDVYKHYFGSSTAAYGIVAGAEGVERAIQERERFDAELRRQEERDRRRQEEEARRRREDAERKRLAEEERVRRQLAEDARQSVIDETRREQEREREEAERIGEDGGEPDALASEEALALLTQHYSREKVMEQLAEVEEKYGVRLVGEKQLADGTIQITLWG